MLFFPYGTPLVLHFLTPIQSSIIALLRHYVRVELSYNIVTMLALPIASIGTYILCRHITRDHVASLVGGLVFMLSPFIVSKMESGWINMAYAGFVPLFFVCLLKATAPEPAKHSRTAPYILTASTLLLLFSSTVNLVFAANLGVCTLLWRIWTSRSWRAESIRIFKALLPTLLVTTPYLVRLIMPEPRFNFGLKKREPVITIICCSALNS